MLDSSRNLLGLVHGVLQMGFDHKVLLRAFLHLPHRHVLLFDECCWNGYTEEDEEEAQWSKR